MVTIQSGGGIVIVGTSGGELAFTNAGTWSVSDCLYVAYGTNASVSFTNLVDGSSVVVDAVGGVQVVAGPDLLTYSAAGFSLAITTVGIILGIKWALRRVLSAGNVAGSAVE